MRQDGTRVSWTRWGRLHPDWTRVGSPRQARGPRQAIEARQAERMPPRVDENVQYRNPIILVSGSLSDRGGNCDGAGKLSFTAFTDCMRRAVIFRLNMASWMWTMLRVPSA